LDLILPFNSMAQSSLLFETSMPTNTDRTCVAAFIVLTFLVCRFRTRCADPSYRSVCEKREMSRGTYLTHRLDLKRPALRLADVSRLSLLDHVGKFTPKAFKVGRGRIRGLSLSHSSGGF
jgi:hypothetical protein